MDIKKLFKEDITISGNLIIISDSIADENQAQTNNAFSDKWATVDQQRGTDKIDKFQRKWYLNLYGFESENELQQFLQTKKIIFDAGCGLGYKSAWFAELAPNSVIIGMDFSDSVIIASKNYRNIPNLFFIKGDIANTRLYNNSIDYINCDQVIHHTENPENTFQHLSDITKTGGEFACYVYAKKALPRELLDDHFRNFSKKCSQEDLWEMSKSLTVLGKKLSELNIEIDVPDISLLGIKGGKYNLQRFIYWNFIKCFWNEDLGYNNSVATNFDWYAPSNAKRYSEKEFQALISKNNLGITYFHKEEACFSGRFKK